MALPKLIDAEEFFADPVFSGASISLVRTEIANLAPAHGRTNAWLRGIDQERVDAVCVIHDVRRGIRAFYWMDDPRWLLYWQATDGNNAGRHEQAAHVLRCLGSTSPPVRRREFADRTLRLMKGEQCLKK